MKLLPKNGNPVVFFLGGERSRPFKFKKISQIIFGMVFMLKDTEVELGVLSKDVL